MSECERWQDMVGALLDGELSDAEANALRAHIAGCEKCAEFCVSFAALSGAMKEGMEPVPGTLHTDVMAKVDAAARAERRGKLLRYLRPALTAAACLAVIVGAALAARPLFRGAGSAASGGTANAGGAGTGMNTSSASAASDSTADFGNLEATEAAPEAPAAPPEPTLAPMEAQPFADSARESAPEADAAQEVETEEAAAQNGEAAEPELRTLELEVETVSKDGFTGTVISSAPEDAAEPGALVTVRTEGEISGVRPGDFVAVRFGKSEETGDGLVIYPDALEQTGGE